jgi:hypothetical protein
MNFATAPRQPLTRLDIPDGARWCEMSIRAGTLGYADPPPHRLGYDFARTSESMLVAFARHQHRQRVIQDAMSQQAALLREAWGWNRPVRDAAREFNEHLDAVGTSDADDANFKIGMRLNSEPE